MVSFRRTNLALVVLQVPPFLLQISRIAMSLALSMSDVLLLQHLTTVAPIKLAAFAALLITQLFQTVPALSLSLFPIPVPIRFLSIAAALLAGLTALPVL